MPLELARRSFTVDEFHRIAEAGVFGEDDRVELIGGDILMMSPIGPGHVYYVNRITAVLVPRVGDRAVVSVQNPLIVDPRSEPLPDVLVLKPRGLHYRTHLPQREDVLLAIEVADTSLSYDRQVKRRLYAEAAVPEYWILDVAGVAIERYTGPRVDGYSHMDRLLPGDSISLVAIPDCTIVVGEIL